MQSLGISTDDVWTLFLLIDVDDNGVVDIEEFVAGCMQLRGPAQSLQVAKMAYENKLTRNTAAQMGLWNALDGRRLELQVCSSA